MSSPVLDRVDALFTHRDRHSALWDQIARYVIPSRTVFSEATSNNGQRERMVLDSTAPQSLVLFASFLHTTLNNPADRWFCVEGVDRNALGVDPAFNRWAEATETGINTEFATGPAPVYDVLHEILLDIGAFGWSCAYTHMHKGRFRLRYVGIANAAGGEGPEGTIDTVACREAMTLLAARKRWPGRSLGPMLDRVPDNRAAQEMCHFVHIVFPREDEELYGHLPAETREVDADFYGMWLSRDTGHIVVSGWYDQMPYIFPRWAKVAGSPYGRSPAMTALGDIIMLNRMNETTLRGAEKLVDPPLMIRDGAILSPVRIFPGGITYTDGDVEPRPVIPPGASRIELGYELIRQRQEAVRNAFFVPLFINPDQPVKTATQVLQEADERNRAAAPMVVRIHHELYNPLISRAWSLLLRAGKLPPPPEAVFRAGGARVGFMNPILSSQRQLSGLAAMRWFESLAPWGQTDPGVFDWADPDQVARLLHQAAGAPAAMLRGENEVRSLRRARQEAEQAQAETANALAGMEATAKLVAAQGGRR